MNELMLCIPTDISTQVALSESKSLHKDVPHISTHETGSSAPREGDVQYSGGEDNWEDGCSG